MPTPVIILRTVSLLAFAGPMLLGVSGRRGRHKARAGQRGGDRVPVVANFAAFAVFFLALLSFAGSSEGSTALVLASSGSLLAVAGAALVLSSRAELGPAWSFVPKADQGTGLVTTGPYRLVRHPIYLGFTILAMGEVLAFSSWPAFVIVLCGIVPTFVWRARAEEKMLSRAFGERYALYCSGISMPAAANLGLVRPPFVYLGSIALGLVVHDAWPARFVPPSLSAPVGAILTLVAVGLFVAAVRAFRAAGTPVPGDRPTTAIVRTGPYRFSRNPIYLAFSLFQLGLSVWINSLGVLMTLVPAVSLMAFVVIPREERHLEARFPVEYSSYRAAVRRWF